MAVPTSYTTATLSTYMATVLGDVASTLGFSDPGSYAEAVNDAAFAYGGISDVSAATDMVKLRALARRAAWRLAAANAAARYDFQSSRNKQFDRSQLFKHIKEQAGMAELEAMPYDTVTHQITVTDNATHEDYYATPFKFRDSATS